MTARPRTLRPAAIAALVLASACTRGETDLGPKADPAARAGGRLVVAITQPASIDPTNAYEPAGSLVVSTMCDTLVGFDPENAEIRPAIAESWQIADSGRRITMKLRRGVKFHDGRDVTAEDVLFSLSRLAGQEFASFVSDLMRPVVGFEQIHGDVEGADRRSREELTGVRVIDSSSFEIRLKEEQADFIRVLGHPATAPVSKQAAAADPAAFGKRPVCAGPYRLEAPWEASQPAILLRRFDDYYARNRSSTRGGAGYADEIEFRIGAGADAGVAAFRAGDVDVTRLPQEAIAAAGSFGDDVQRGVAGSLDYVGLPQGTRPFDVRAVRVALSQAIDRRAIADGAFGGGRAPATGILPPSVGRAYRNDACSRNAPRGGDVSAARASLRSSGVDLTGVPVKLLYNDEFENGLLARTVAEQWTAAFGLRVELVPMDWERYLALAKQQTGFDGAFRMSWAAPYPSADAYLEPLFHSSSIGADNFTRFSDRDYDRALERDARRALDEQERADRYRRLEDVVCEQMPLIPVTFPTRAYLVRKSRVDSAVPAFVDRAWGRPALRELFVRA